MPKTRKPKKKETAVEFPGGIPKPKKRENPFDKFSDAVGEIKGWDQASEVLDTVEAVRTNMPDFNLATRVGGLPIRRITTIHGPTHGGKSAFTLALVKSFVDQGYLAAYVDAEHTLGREFAGTMVKDLSERPNFVAERPETYEQTIAKVDVFLDKCQEVKKQHPDFKSIIVVDSINKLVPKRELDKILKGGSINEKGAEEATKGHFGRYRASVNQSWLDYLVPRIGRANCALVIITQERASDDPHAFFNDNFDLKGGQALKFDSSLIVRVSKASPIYPGSEKKNDLICGFRHKVRVWKSKVGNMDGRYTDCEFSMSNGRLCSPGFDVARDLVRVGTELGVVNKAGSWLTYRSKRFQGENKMISNLYETPELLEELDYDVNLEIDRVQGRVTDEDSSVL